MHATYPWEENKDVPAFTMDQATTWPSESIENRRIRVYRKAIDLYALGKNWEKCLAYCELLRTFYEREFMYEKLSSVFKILGVTTNLFSVFFFFNLQHKKGSKN